VIELREDELAGLKRLVKFVEPKSCTDITGEPCGCILSDECSACIEIDAALNWIREAKVAESRGS